MTVRCAKTGRSFDDTELNWSSFPVTLKGEKYFYPSLFKCKNILKITKFIINTFYLKVNSCYNESPIALYNMEALPSPRKCPFYVFHLLINITTLKTPEIEISICLTSKIPHLYPFYFNFLMI